MLAGLGKSLFKHFWGQILLLILNACCLCFAGPSDLEIDGTFEAAVSLPKIYFLFQREPNGLPLEVDGSFEINYAFLDTGASGLLISRETAEIMDINTAPGAQFVDTGVAGDEFFDVSEELYIGVAGFSVENPEDPSIYKVSGPWRLQVNQTYSDELLGPIDLLGIPLMAGKTVVLDTGVTNSLLEDTKADILEPNDPSIPVSDFLVPLRFEKYIFPIIRAISRPCLRLPIIL